MSGLLLGIHSAAGTLGLAVLDVEAGTVRDRAWQLERQMVEQLHPCLQEFLPPEQWSALAGVAVAVGPGSFTSCRLGVTVARTLGQTFDIPVFGVSSLAAIAYAALSDPGSGFAVPTSRAAAQIAVQMDAKRGEWYGGIFELVDETLKTIEADRLWTEPEWLDRIKGLPSLNAVVFETKPPTVAMTQLAWHR
ncbi:MAG: tRNA (adenosine(37)-N6)-threonylcarbamoyltransferase complex dimerization subunit type 1 TsaB, partial [Cyanobacteria bacterium J06648_11]